MDPLSIISTSVGLASVIAKVSMTLTSFARDARDAAKDLDAISAELKAVSTVIALLGRSLSPSSAESPIPEALLQQIDVMLLGTTAVVEQIQENVQKYQSNKIFSKASWAMFGQGDMQKLRESLEAYKMALSLGMHAVSSTVNQAVKEDTSAIHEYAIAIKINTDDILARVNSIRRDGQPNRHKRVEDWIEDMTVLSSYADTTYQGTIMDPADIADMAAVSESESHLSEDSELSPSPGGPSPDHSQHTTTAQSKGADPGGSSTQHVARLTSGEISAPSTPTAAPSGISADNPESSTPTSALTRNSEDIDGTGNDTSHQLSLFGWKPQTSVQKPPLGALGTGESLLFRTALKRFHHPSEAQVSGGEPPHLHRHCEVSLFEWFPTSEASAMENAPSFVFFTVTLSPNVSETPRTPSSTLFSIPKPMSYGGQPEAGDEEVILTFFDAKSLLDFRGHLLGSSPRLDGTRHEFALAGYNALEYGGLGTSARVPRPIDKLLATTPTWPTLSIFKPSTLGPPHRLVVESQDGLTFINTRIGPQYHKFIRPSCVKADECSLVISQSLISGSRCNFLLFTSSSGSAKPASINGRELQGIHQEQQAYCEYRFQNLGSLYRFQQAMTGYTVVYDGWPHMAVFGRQDVGFLNLPTGIFWGHTARQPRVQILRDTSNGAIRVAIFSPPRRRHPNPSQTSFELSQRNRFTYYAMNNSEKWHGVGITDDSSTLPSDTIDEWKGVSPNEANFLDLSIGGGKTGKSNKTTFYFKDESEGDKLVECLMSMGLRVRSGGL